MILITPELADEFLSDIEERTAMIVRNAKIEELSPSERNQVEIILSYGNYNDVITTKHLQLLPHLKWIQLLSSGTDQLPLHEIEKREIKVTTARGIHGIPISEYVFAMLLYFSKKIPAYNRSKQKKEWKMQGTYELHHKTIGIWGTGVIGKEIAKKAKAFGMIPYGVNRSGQQYEEFHEVFQITELEKYVGMFDVIASALPSNEGTIHLVNEQLIDKMQDGVIFVNVGRGDLIVEDDFVRAVKRKKFTGVALDVFEEEPLPADNKLWELEDVIMTPHISASTNMYIPRALDLFYSYFKQYKQNGQNNREI